MFSMNSGAFIPAFKSGPLWVTDLLHLGTLKVKGLTVKRPADRIVNITSNNHTKENN
jgi:hypothetical protein